MLYSRCSMLSIHSMGFCYFMCFVLCRITIHFFFFSLSGCSRCCLVSLKFPVVLLCSKYVMLSMVMPTVLLKINHKLLQEWDRMHVKTPKCIVFEMKRNIDVKLLSNPLMLKWILSECVCVCFLFAFSILWIERLCIELVIWGIFLKFSWKRV